jgi:hypothetical protein
MVEKMKANIFCVAGCIALALFVSGASGANRAVASGSVCADEPETIMASAKHPVTRKLGAFIFCSPVMAC